MSETAQTKRIKNQKRRVESLAFLLTSAAILIVLNVLAASFGVARCDLTENGIFSLSAGSKELAAGLEDQLEIVAYFSSNLPPPHNATERYARDLLAEYRAASGGKIKVRFVDPSTDEERKSAESDGVRLVAQRIFANDSVSVVEGYRGIALKYLGEKKAIPIVESTTGLEYRVTMAMRELVGEKIRVGLVKDKQPEGAEEVFGHLKRALRVYEIVEIDVSEPISPSLKAALIIGPELEFSEAELKNLDRFVSQGGALGVFGGSVKASGYGLEGEVFDSGLNRLLEHWGVHLRSDLVADSECEYAAIQTSAGTMPRRYPYRPILTFSAEERAHPLISGLVNASLPFTSSVELRTPPEGVSVTVLGRSSERSFRSKGPRFNLDPARDFYVEGELERSPVLVAIEGPLPSAFGEASPPERRSRVVVAGSAAMTMLPIPEGQAVDEELATQYLALPLNIVDWLANDEALVAIRSKNVDEPRLNIPSVVLQAQEDIDAAAMENDAAAALEAQERGKAALESWNRKKTLYRVGFALGLPLLVAAFGIVRSRRRRALKDSISFE